MPDQDLGVVGLEPETDAGLGYEGQPTDEGEGAVTVGDEGSPQDGETYYDPSTVPPELQPTFREMQKSYTQKTQAVAALRRQAEQQLQQTALATQKSVVFDQLMQDQRVRDFLHELDHAPEAGSEDQELDPTMAQAIQRATAPINQRVQHLQGQLEMQVALAAFQKSHPDWEQHVGAMQQAWEQDRLAGRSQRSFEDAYNWAFVQQARVARPPRRPPQPGAAVESGGVSKAVAPSAPDLKGDRRAAFRNAVDWALDQHGIDRKTFHAPRNPLAQR